MSEPTYPLGHHGPREPYFGQEPKQPQPDPLTDLIRLVRESSLNVHDRSQNEEWARVIAVWAKRWYVPKPELPE